MTGWIALAVSVITLLVVLFKHTEHECPLTGRKCEYNTCSPCWYYQDSQKRLDHIKDVLTKHKGKI